MNQQSNDVEQSHLVSTQNAYPPPQSIPYQYPAPHHSPAVHPPISYPNPPQHIYVASPQKDSTGRHIWRAVYLLLAYLGMQVLIGIVLASFILTSGSPNSLLYGASENDLLWLAFIILGVCEILIIPIYFLFLNMDKKRRIKQGSYKKYQKLPIGKAFLCLGIGICSALLVRGIFNLIGDDSLLYQQEFYSASPILAIFLVGLLTPFAEELCFRALLYGRLREWMSPISAGLLSSLVFAMVHGNAEQGVTAFFYGFAMALVYERWKSIVAPFLVHAGVNCAVVIIAILPGTNVDSILWIPFPLVTLCALLLLAGGIFLAIKLSPSKQINQSIQPIVYPPPR